MRNRCSRIAKRVGTLALIGGLCVGQLREDQPHAVPGHQPDTGPEWAYNPATDRQPFANGSNTRLAYAGVANGRGVAHDASIRLDFASKA